MITLARLQQLLEQEWEDDLPDQVLEVFRRHDGKRLTVHLLKDLPGLTASGSQPPEAKPISKGEERWRLTHGVGMTQLQEWSYCRTQGREGYNFLLAHTEKNVIVSAHDLQQLNKGYFAGRVERNALRLEAKNDPVLQGMMVEAINEVLSLNAKLRMAEQQLAHLTTGDGIFSPDRYLWESISEGEKE